MIRITIHDLSDQTEAFCVTDDSGEFDSAHYDSLAEAEEDAEDRLAQLEDMGLTATIEKL